MIIECPKCHSKYEVDEAYIPIGGAPVQCPKCGNIFGIYVMPIDIPMTPVFDAEPAQQPAAQPAPAPSPAPQPEPVQQAAQPEPVKQAPQPGPAPQTQAPADDYSGFGAIPEQKNDSDTDIGANPSQQQDFGGFDMPSADAPANSGSELGGLGFDAPAPEAPSPDLGSMMDQVEEAPAEAPSPDLGALGFGAQPEPAPAPEMPSPDLGSMMDQVEEAPAEAPSPDLGALGFGAQPEPTPAPAPQPEPDLGNKPDVQAQPEATSADLGALGFGAQPQAQSEPAKQAPQPDQAEVAKKVGSMFESLLAGFSLPDNFKNLPPNIQKNHKDAIKLARQLAKDILLYHKDDVERGVANGNLKDVLKDEIEKSFKFYTQRVQPELLETTNYFTEALNKIVAKGQNIF